MKSLGDALRPLADPIARARTRLGSSTSADDAADDRASGPPPCPICGGVGWLRHDVPVGHPEFGRAYPCRCIADDLAARRAEGVRQASHLAALDGMTFETFTIEASGNSPESAASLHTAMTEARAFAAQPKGWLVLWGGYGTGKTHLAAAIANARLAEGEPVLFVVVPDLLDYLRAGFARDADGDLDARLEAVRGAPLLILDDLGTQAPTPWAGEKLFQILNHRYTHQLPTVITTNVAPDAFDERLRSRFGHAGFAKQIDIRTIDYRLGLPHESDELSSLHLYADQTFATWNVRSGYVQRTEAEHLARAQHEAYTWAMNPTGWFVILGAHGVGKTHLAAAIANAYAANGGEALFVVVPDLLDHLRNTFSPNSKVDYDQRFDEVRRAPLLVLDDLGTESATPWAQEKLFQLLNHRYAARLPTVITTTSNLDNLHSSLRTRMFDRRLCTLFEIVAPPYHGPTTPSAAPGAPRGGGRRRSA
ncbi:MAG: ATP-binding protein [Ardenticatenales bacterium]|nr:ATP-binding protein [Ardenticatenales bacterium]